MKRIVSLWLPFWATDRLARRLSAHTDRVGIAPPSATIAEFAGRALVMSPNPAALAAGIAAGMSLADARALQPDLLTHPADPTGDATALARLADWCGRYTPWVAGEGSDGLWLDVTGAAHLFGGEAAMMEDLHRRLTTFGYSLRLAMADSPGAAWALAHYGAADAAPKLTLTPKILAPGAARETLQDLPVAALRLSSATVEELARLGLRRIGDLYGLPRAALARRFGFDLGRRLDQALGRVEEPISPRRPPARHETRLSFAEPILEPAQIAAALAGLTKALCLHLTAEKLGARRLILTGYRVDGSLLRCEIGTAQPNRDATTLNRLFAARLEAIDPGFGIETLILSVPQAEPLTDLQMVLLEARAVQAPKADRKPLSSAALEETGQGPSSAKEASVHGRKSDPARDTRAPSDSAIETYALEEKLGTLIDSLANLPEPIASYRLAPRASHLPERAVLREPAAVFASALAGATAPTAWPERAARPVRLLPRPEPIETEAATGEDLPKLFRWRSQPYRVRAVEGPERIAAEWWREGGAGERDYYRIEDDVGRRFWLYCERARRIGGGKTPPPSRWYLHGLFA